MTPFFFGPQDRQLFAAYDPPRVHRARGRAVLICNPWGREQFLAHRTLRHLASLLAGAGCHALRFDYYGTGDSSGDDADADLAGWTTDVQLAIDELKDTSGARRVSVVGLRLGADLALRAAQGRRDVEQLILWDPVVDGGTYHTELERAHAELIGASRSNSFVCGLDGAVDVLGLHVPGALLEQIAQLDQTPLDGDLHAQVRVVLSQAAPAALRLVADLTARGATVGVDEIPAPSPWTGGNFGVGAIPAAVLQHIVELVS